MSITSHRNPNPGTTFQATSMESLILSLNDIEAIKFGTFTLKSGVNSYRIDSPSWRNGSESDRDILIKATGGGAYKYADIFKERLGVSIEKEDGMACLVSGANFLLKTIRHEAFTHMEGQKEFVQIDQNDLFPYLLVNIGSGVSIIKVDGEGKYQRVSGTNVGGGTYWGLGRLLTKCKRLSFPHFCDYTNSYHKYGVI